MRQYLNWKTYLIIVASIIVGTSIFYTSELAKKLSYEEKKKVEMLVEGIKLNINTNEPLTQAYIQTLLDSNKTIPLILTNERDSIQSSVNIDATLLKKDSGYLHRALEEFRKENQPIVCDFGSGKQYVYYSESSLLKQLKYFPYVQLVVILVFLVVVLIALSSAHRSIQNQVWVGLSKETAHQLGTPLSSIEAWIELLKIDSGNADALYEMQKDLDRLKLIADRFSKVGSTPQLEEENLIVRLNEMVNYMQKRAPKKVIISLNATESDIPVYISGPLFDWVIENLMRNALDAMEGSGAIEVKVTNHPHNVWIDICDTGKGIPKYQIKKVFNPGFTTKKRGWGLGLSLSKRIITKYHHGSIFVKHSEVGKGTTFRIILRS